MKLTRISTEHYNGQSSCKRCNPTGSYTGYINWACMMVEFTEIKGHYCPKCAKEIEDKYLKRGGYGKWELTHSPRAAWQISAARNRLSRQ